MAISGVMATMATTPKASVTILPPTAEHAPIAKGSRKVVAMTPLITIQGLGLIYRLRTKHGAVAPAPAVSGDAFALDDLAIIDL